MVCLLIGDGIALAQVHKISSLSGKIANHGNYTKIYLDSLGLSESINVAFSPIDANGSFSMKMLVLKPDIYKLRLEDNNFIYLIISPSENITIQTTVPKLDFSLKISGSSQSMDLFSTMNAIMPYNKIIDSLNKQYTKVINTPKRDSLVPLIITSITNTYIKQKDEITSRILKNPASLAWLFFMDKFDINTTLLSAS